MWDLQWWKGDWLEKSDASLLRVPVFHDWSCSVLWVLSHCLKLTQHKHVLSLAVLQSFPSSLWLLIFLTKQFSQKLYACQQPLKFCIEQSGTDGNVCSFSRPGSGKTQQSELWVYIWGHGFCPITCQICQKCLTEALYYHTLVKWFACRGNRALINWMNCTLFMTDCNSTVFCVLYISVTNPGRIWLICVCIKA